MTQDRQKLRDAIEATLRLADDLGESLVAAILQGALDAVPSSEERQA